MRALLYVAAFSCYTGLAVPCLACTCAPGLPLNANIKNMRDLVTWEFVGAKQSDVIFEGIVERQEIAAGPIGSPETAMSMTPQGSHRIVTIRSLGTFRGPSQDRFTILTGLGGGDCGFDFETGKKYLVFAEADESGVLFTSICTRTALSEHSGPALRFLRGEPAAPEDLLDLDTYYKEYTVRWAGKVCGRIASADGKPLPEAVVNLWQVRDDPFPANDFGEVSKADGSFCITSVFPGKYLLTASVTDHDRWTRLVVYYPGVQRRSEAIPIAVSADATVSEPPLRLYKESLYRLKIHLVAADGSALPLHVLGVCIDSPDRDPLTYHAHHLVDADGSWSFGYVPEGDYVLTYFVQSDSEAELTSTNISRWEPTKREIKITGDTEVTLELELAK